ncbi:MAG: hypothetical protein J6B89_03465 [Bacilli bacterium]|nr:hypothetical protein [Bacilli bacterium]
MKENYEIEINSLIKEYEKKHSELDKKTSSVDRLCIKQSEYDKLTKWFLEKKLKLMKKYNMDTQE